VGERYGAA
jgi:hypothetical protein